MKRLGKMGLLGNQMFQYASLRGIAGHRGFEFCIPPSKFKDRSRHHQLLEAFKLEGLEHIAVLDGETIREKHFLFDEDLFENMPDGGNIRGYLQTERYFAQIEDKIRKDFQFKDEISAPCSQEIEALDHPIALHVRRGDYVDSVNHPLCSKEYYNQALAKFDSERQVLVFSDDPGWCQEQFSDARFVISEKPDNVADPCLMSLCSAHIIANSSFSWWGAWLADSEIVFAPKRWFGATGYTASYEIKDLIPQRWTKLDFYVVQSGPS